MTVVSVREKLSATRAYRLESIDMVRGLVIVIMAIDHVRDYFNFGGEPDPLANPDIGAALFFTRWITHFCAPVFVFLAGTSAGLMTSRRTPSALAAFLFTRGAWLIFIEWGRRDGPWERACASSRRRTTPAASARLPPSHERSWFAR